MADSTRKTTRGRGSGSRSRSTSSGSKRSTGTSSRKRTTTSRSRASGGSRSTTRRSQTSSRSGQQQQQPESNGLSTGKLVALGAAVGGLTGAALLIRKLRSHGDDEHDDEEYDDEEEDDDEPRGRHEEDDEDDGDEAYEDDDEDDDDDEPQARFDHDEDEDEDFGEEDEDAEDDEPQARSSSSDHSRDEDDGDRGFASTIWDAVVEGVRSSSAGKREKASRTQSRGGADEEDDDSDRRPRGAKKTERSRAATRAPRGDESRNDRHGDGGEAMSLVRRAKRQLVELTGHEAESVSGIEHDGDGRTRVRLEVLELERIPRTTDVLASYELTLDEDGRLLECTRVGRYSRSNAETGVA